MIIKTRVGFSDELSIKPLLATAGLIACYQ